MAELPPQKLLGSFFVASLCLLDRTTLRAANSALRLQCGCRTRRPWSACTHLARPAMARPSASRPSLAGARLSCMPSVTPVTWQELLNAFLPPCCSMPAASASVWSADGALLALMSAGVVTVYDTATEEQVRLQTAHTGTQSGPLGMPIAHVEHTQVARLEVPGVMAAAFSPRGTYLATFQRTRPDAGNTEKNLKARPSASPADGCPAGMLKPNVVYAFDVEPAGPASCLSGLLAASGAALRGGAPLCGSCGTGARGSRR